MFENYILVCISGCFWKCELKFRINALKIGSGKKKVVDWLSKKRFKEFNVLKQKNIGPSLPKWQLHSSSLYQQVWGRKSDLTQEDQIINNLIVHLNSNSVQEKSR